VKDENEEIEVYKGSGNPFADAGFSNPEEALAKAELARQIYKVIKSKRITQTQAAKIMGIAQPKVSEIVRGKLSGFTIDRLMRFLRLLGRDVEIHIKKHEQKNRNPWLAVVDETRPKGKRAF